MVIKLVKRELRDSSTSFVPVLAAILAGSVLLPLQIRFFNSIGFLNAIVNIVLMLLFFTAMILSIRASFYILYTNMYNKSGYELFTLPVKLWEIVVSKLITLVIWYVALSIVTGVGMVLMTAILSGDIGFIFEQIGYAFSFFSDYFSSSDVLLTVLVGTLGLLRDVLVIFFAGAVANSSRFSKNRAWWTFLFVVLLSWGVSLISTSLDLNLFRGFNLVLYGNSISSFTLGIVPGLVIAITAFELVLSGLFFFGTLWFWDNKLEILN